MKTLVAVGRKLSDLIFYFALRNAKIAREAADAERDRRLYEEDAIGIGGYG